MNKVHNNDRLGEKYINDSSTSIVLWAADLGTSAAAYAQQAAEALGRTEGASKPSPTAVHGVSDAGPRLPTQA
jgi:hypothetical protein